ncbi:MAG TPA: 30S ribosomal protein S19e [Nitrososphaerales archaeon]|jgi:small subunit ribosomal protein S19e
MPTAQDVPQDILIKRLAEHLRKVQQISPPAWAPFAKTGSHAEHPPQDRDWWHKRCASLLRKIYLHAPIGLTELEAAYGGRTRVGYSKAHHRDAGGAAIRKPIQQLEAAGLVTKKANSGRILTSEGVKLVDRISREIFKGLAKEEPKLARYL